MNNVFVVLSLLAIAVAATDNKDNKVIYGQDDRQEPYTITSDNILKLIQADVAIVFKDDLTQNVDGNWRLTSSYYYYYQNCGDSSELCSDEPFLGQRLAPFCSGFLIANNDNTSRIATAGHCVSYAGCDQMAFIFDYYLPNSLTDSPQVVSIPEDNVFFCANFQYQLDSASDWGVVELDRYVPNREALPLRQSGEVDEGTPLIMVGHPSGLPAKVDDGASVKTLHSTYFSANTDSYGGNSGSMVVNTMTWEVEGILVRGNKDFVYDAANGCCRSNVCSDETGCPDFEDITKVSEIVKYVTEPLCNCKSEGSLLEPMFFMILTILAQFFDFRIY